MYISNTATQNLLDVILKMKVTDDEVLFIMLGEKDNLHLPLFISELNELNISFFGGIFPGIIYDEQKYEEGAIVTKFPVLGKPLLVKGLDSGNIDLPDMTEILKILNKKYAAMILVDGLTGNISRFLTLLYSKLANSVNYFGGGAGSLTLKQKPCIFTSAGLFQDAAVIVFLQLECQLGVRHGWERIMGPIVATETDRNTIIELNWNKAFDVYREIVERDSGKKITANNFFDIAKGYPFGMLKQYAECVVRDPITVGSNGELICVGEIPENSVLDILKGEATSLIDAAGQAAGACKTASGKKVTHSFIVDCISRVLFLENNFYRELHEIKTKFKGIDQYSVPMGMLTLGEISSYGEGFLEFFNKTIVTGILYE
ncbi:MAG: FIST C-terminal domain-containing protein [Bacillota bacterium]